MNPRLTATQLWSVGVLLLLASDWAAGYSIAHVVMSHGVSPLGYAFWQSLGPALFLLPIAVFNRSLRWRHRRFYVTTGLFGIALPNTNMYFVAAHLPAGVLAMWMNIVPVITYLLALAAGEERFSAYRGAALSLFVVSLLLLVTAGHSVATVSWHWFGLALLTPCCFAWCAVYSARYRPRGSDVVGIAAGMLLVSTLLLAPLVLATQHFVPFSWPLNPTQQLIILEIMLSSIGYLLFFHLIQVAGSVFYSLTSGMVAVMGLVIAAFFLQEWPTALEFDGEPRHHQRHLYYGALSTIKLFVTVNRLNIRSQIYTLATVTVLQASRHCHLFG